MIILLCGEDSCRSRQKLKEIIKEYKAKHQSGLNLVRFREDNFSFGKLKESIESVSMFEEKKLIVLESLFNQSNFSDGFFKYANSKKLKSNQDAVVVIYQPEKIKISGLKGKVNILGEFKFLEGSALVGWLKREAAKNKITISPEAIRKLIAYIGNDLWQMSSEINKLAAYKKEGLIEERDVDLMVRAKVGTNIFKTLDALACRDKKSALKYLYEHLEQGENEMYLFSMLVYQLRTLLKLKDLEQKGVPFYGLAEKSGLHPFVVKKSWQQIKNFKLEQLKNIYKRLLEIDLSIKKGRLDGPTALDLFVAEI